MRADLSPVHVRILGCLVEKAATTPDQYPLTTNALRAACNQRTSRDPVTDLGERDIDAAMLELREHKLARTVSGSGHRTVKHKHVLDEALGLDAVELAVLAVLLLRGPQTRNEIVTRTARYRDDEGDDEAVDRAIDRLAARDDPLVVRLAREPGAREPRIDQCWAPRIAAMDEPVPSAAPASASAPTATSPPAGESIGAGSAEDGVAALTGRVAALEAQVADQQRRIEALVEQLGG